LIINSCFEKLHYLEFVKPVENVLRNTGLRFLTKHYSELRDKDLERAERVIICGTSLKDNEYLRDIDKFFWIKDFNKPILGICSGMQIIGLVFGGVLKRHLEIGYFYEDFKESFLGAKGDVEVYHLHNNYVSFGNNFDVFAGDKIPEAVKMKEREIYCTMFHPEVRNKNMILEFCKK